MVDSVSSRQPDPDGPNNRSMDFLLLRPEDHVVLGVGWSGMRVVATGADGLPALEAVGADARLVVMFPPQHTAEQTLAEDAGAPVGGWRAALSGPSRITVPLPAGTRLVPTVEAVLAALHDRQLLAGDQPWAAGTSIELPWRVALSPQVRPATGVNLAHPSTPVTADGATGLWRTRLVGTSLRLYAVDPGLASAADPDFAIPLPRVERMRLADGAGRSPARATRLELSALGGTLAAAGAWPGFTWDHRAVLGRDMRVRTLATGACYPLGHRAEYFSYTERVFDPDLRAAVLRTRVVLTITEAVRQPPADGPVRRAFPFDEVEITTLVYPGLEQPSGAYFWPTTTAGERVRFPVRCASPTGDVTFELPLLFVGDRSDVQPAALAREYGLVRVPLAGRVLDLARAAQPVPGDRHEVHTITIAGSSAPDDLRPRLDSFDVALPAIRSLLGDAAARTMRYADEFLTGGTAAPVLLRLVGNGIDVSFAGRTQLSGGLAAPSYLADAVSRELGPVNSSALPQLATGLINPGTLLRPDATLLGFALRDLVRQLRVPPQITSKLGHGGAPEVTMSWTDVRLRPFGPFQADERSRLAELTATVTPTGSRTTCTVRDFALLLPSPAHPLLRLAFGQLSFTQRDGRPPQVDVQGVDATFLGELQLLEELQEKVDLGGAAPHLESTTTGVIARYSLPLPPVSAGAFVLRNVLLSAAIEVPFDGRPVTVSLGFASRTNRFALTVLMFGGGGYIDLALDHTGLRRLELALEFGALVAVNFGVASAEVHALGGVTFALAADGSVAVSGYLRIGGCVEILGLVSVSIELSIALTYRSDTKALVGRATLVVEVDLTLWSDSFELDTGEWVLAGGSAPATKHELGRSQLFAADDDDGLARWRRYRAAFAPQHLGDGA